MLEPTPKRITDEVWCLYLERAKRAETNKARQYGTAAADSAYLGFVERSRLHARNAATHAIIVLRIRAELERMAADR
jgi:hypothetical protein